MNLAQGAFNKVVNRPFLLIFTALFSLIYTMVDILNPITAIVFGFSSMGNGDILGTIISLLQTILTPKLLITSFKWIIPGIIILALIISTLLSGYFYILNNTIKGFNKQGSEFITGIKMYFTKVLRVTLTSFLIGFVFILFISIVVVPSLFTIWSWRQGKPELMIMAVFLSFITAIVVFFSIMFFQLYVLYWYPSVYSFNAKPFREGKETVEKRFWELLGRWILFDIALIIFESMFLYFKYMVFQGGGESVLFTAILFIGKFTFTSSFFIWMTTFIFASFNSIKEI